MIAQNIFRILVEKHKNSVYAYACYMLRNSADAEDVTQDVLIKFWNHRNEINMIAIKAWLIRTTRNRCLDVIRKRQRTDNKVTSLDNSLSEFTPDDRAENPVKEMDRKILKDRINVAIDSLPEKLRSVFVLYEIQGLKYREIAQVLDIPLNSVKVYINRARLALQKKLTIHEKSSTTEIATA